MIEQENPHLKSEQDTVVEAICDLMESGAPCEIVDGDNNYFSKRVLSKVGALLDQRRAARRKGSMPSCVVCLIGPQSSGKSMLANSLFGCQFAVSEGRCTRGIYGSVVPANVEGEQDLFVLDTEGLLSIEKGDPEFDRFMFLFCLAVSEVVIINVKGNLSEPMKQLLAVCVRALRHLEIAKVSSPSIFVVLNQMADTNRDHHIQAFQVIEQELIKMFKELLPFPSCLFSPFLPISSPSHLPLPSCPQASPPTLHEHLPCLLAPSGSHTACSFNGSVGMLTLSSI